MDELQDVYNEKGEKTDITKSKMQIFKDGDWRLVIHVCVVDSLGRLFVQQRAKKGIFDELWDVSVGGGVLAGEDPQVAAQRELNEELGLLFDQNQFENIGRYKVPKYIPEMGLWMNEFSETYLVRNDAEIDSLHLQSNEVRQVKLIPVDECVTEATSPTTRSLWVPHGDAYYQNVGHMIRELVG